jgi:hypothetical protein
LRRCRRRRGFGLDVLERLLGDCRARFAAAGDGDLRERERDAVGRERLRVTNCFPDQAPPAM